MNREDELIENQTDPESAIVTQKRTIRIIRSAEVRAKISAGMRGKKLTAEHKANLSKATKRYYENPKAREKKSSEVQKLWENNEYREKVSAGLKKYYDSPENHVRYWGVHSNTRKSSNYIEKLPTDSAISKALSQIGKLPPEIDCRIENGQITVKCAKCGKRFQTNTTSLKVQKWRFEHRGDAYMHCSEECRDSCPVYGFNTSSTDPRSKKFVPKDVRVSVRACQSKVLKQLQCDEVGYNYCERCGDIITDVEHHHTLPISKFGHESENPASHMLTCLRCHKILHNDCTDI